NVVYAKGTFFGNANNDAYLLSMAMDKNGCIYGTGVCTSIPTTTGAYNERNNGGFDVMVFKLDPTMTFLIWATYIGGSGNDGGGSIAVNDAGEVFVSGYTYSSNFPYTGSFGLDLQYLQTQVVCYYALKLSADGGQLLYSRILGGGIQMMIETENATKGANIAINSAGEAFVFAHTQSTSPYMLTGNAFQVIPGGSIDAMFTKLGARGDLLYSTYVGGFNDEEANGICYANGKIYCIGTTGSNNFPKQTNRQPDNADSYILMWEDGQTPRLVKSYIYGCDGNDRGLSVYYDRMYNRLLFTGRTSNSTINATSTLLTGHPYGGYVGAIDDSLGVIQFLTIISKGAMPTACMPRRNGSIYVGGYVDGLLPVTANAYQGVPMGGMDGMLVAVTADGSNLLYGSYVGGTNNDYAIANIIITEEMVCSLEVLFGITTHSLDYPSTIDTYQPLKLNAGEDQPSISRFTIPQEKEFMFHAHKACGEDTFRIVFPCLQPQSIMWSFSDIPLVEYNVTQLSHRFPANGTYKVIVRLAYPNNVVFREFNVTVNSYPNIKATQNKIYLCNKNNSVMLNATGGKRYRWFPGKSVSDSTIPNPVVKPTQPNTWYYVRGWDEKGCVSVDSVQVIIVPTTLKVSKDTTICNGQRAKLHADGVNKIFWSPVLGLDRDNGNDVFAKPNVTTTYYATSSNGQCIDTSTVTVYVAQPPKIEFPQAPTTCTGGTVLLQIKAIGNQTIDTAGVQFRWRADNDLLVVSPSDAQVTPLTSKWYWVTATNKYGCTFTDSVYVQVKNTLTVTASNDTTLCLGSSIQLWAAGAATYTWFPPDGLDNPTSPNP
ncbi:MAG: hypothetical protein JNJ85_14170, partial [Candidatus Kapabacteria bacterium]|nr:hypothetical protein [Candidatus Kapabacteria bacterium]